MSFRDDAGVTVAALQAYGERAARREGAVLRQPSIDSLVDELDIERLIAEGGLEGTRLQLFLDRYLSGATRLHHPRYMAHQVGVPVPHAALAALIDGFTNNPMAIYEMGPPAAAIEHAVLNWMMTKVGWRGSACGKQCGAGVLTHGGSLANLTALLAARARCAPWSWTEGIPSNLVLVCSPGSHYSIARASAILGLGAQNAHYAATDALGRIDPELLPGQLRRLCQEGKLPIAVVANAGSTALGLFDPIRDIGAICREHGVWLHVDGAHGASTLLSSRLRHLLNGIEDADSIVWDAHKMLRSPLLCAAVLVRDETALNDAFQQDASYLFHDKDEPGIDFAHRTIECTKAALGLKVFFALAHESESAVAAVIERQTDLAKAAADLLRATPGIDVAVQPQTNIVCFRLHGTDALQLAVRKRLTHDGNFYISTAEALGKRWLRLVLMNPDTTIDDIAELRTEVLALGRG
jgi:L-2,4-diaminobutyrate decarboxylase